MQREKAKANREVPKLQAARIDGPAAISHDER
jgi:hypothetical protein